MQRPAGWQAARDALMAALATRYSPRDLSTLTFTALQARQDLPQDIVDLRNDWRTLWEQMPNGTGRQQDRVFVTKTGNAMQAANVKREGLRWKGRT